MGDHISVDALRRLQERIRHIADSPENRRRSECWEDNAGDARDHWRGVPKKGLGYVPFYADCENSLWARIIGFDLETYYTDPAVYLESQLKMTLYRYQHFSDYAAVGKIVPIWLGVPFEPSFFGVDVVFEPGHDPWIGKRPVIEHEHDLASLKPIDFYHSGLMPVAHRLYSGIGELLDDDFQVAFPEWGRSPFAVAMHLRGMANIAVDLVDQPDFARSLIDYVTQARIEWTTQRFRFLGIPVQRGNLYNDEVNSLLLSPRTYQAFVLPSEQELSRFHGGIAYWHSCGDTTALLESIKQIPNLGMFHRGPWTDLAKVVQVFGGSQRIEICVDPANDIQFASTPAMEEQVLTLQTVLQGRADAVLRIEGSLVDSPHQAVEQLREYIGVARRVLRSTRDDG
ncbi:MAG TPA: uroporphyrinogen decarboxylase family protein [Atribacteraceae bacterium]|nr:uroporphyrinogen decarboxylase family protein [Atribacteraceae bacterium]